MERELGGGGMSRVFLAQDTTLGRQVVVKVLPPELAADVNVERFRREIQVAAKLQHPHLVPVLSAGNDHDLLYYTMPFIEGESLRALLARRGELPVAEAVRLLREIADALSYAHERGVVHRDIKPENVLLTTNHAVVADFGIAKALSDAAPAGAMTSAGVALGTPAYCAPEQAAGDPHTDHRADLYSFGVLAYELLAGHPPFHGLPPQQLLAAHSITAPQPVTDVRPAIPPQLGALVMRLLEKRPADRPQSAAEVLAELSTIGDARPGHLVEGTVSSTDTPSARTRRRIVPALLIALVLAIAAGLAYGRRDAGSGELDPNAVAVLPFRVTGDPALGYLGEGMLDLLAAKLTGEGGPRAAEPGTVLAAWRRQGSGTSQQDAVRLAHDLGSSQVILGSIVGTGDRLTLTATLLAVPSERTRASATVEGSVDSLGALVDRLAAELLALRAGARETLGGSLAVVPLPALRAYLDGRAAFRQGQYGQAGVHFDEALRRDSSFAHAALGVMQAESWSPVPDQPFARRVIDREGGRLDARDRAMATALLSRYTPAGVPFIQQLDAWHRAVQLSPDRADAWYELGDVYFHFGALAQVSDWRERSRNAFNRAVELDSSFTAPLGHLLELALLEGARERTRSLWQLYSSRASQAELTDFIRWRVAIALDDTAQLRAFRERVDELPVSSLLRISGGMTVEGVGLEDAPLVIRALRGRASTRMDIFRGGRNSVLLLFNMGRHREGRRYYAQILQGFPESDAILAVVHVLSALYWDGDRDLGRRSLPLLEAIARRSLTDESAVRTFSAACALAQWHANDGDLDAAERHLTRAREARDQMRRTQEGEWRVCTATVEALLDVQRGRVHGPATVRLQALLDEAPHFPEEAMLVMARIHEVRGDIPRALATVRRRANHWNFGVQYLSTFLREEGRLAALAGDAEGAIRAYRHYAALREHADPEMRASVDAVRTELARLEGADR